MNKEEQRMPPEMLEQWLHIRKKCAAYKSKKDYSRKDKHRKDHRFDDDDI